MNNFKKMTIMFRFAFQKYPMFAKKIKFNDIQNNFGLHESEYFSCYCVLAQ